MYLCMSACNDSYDTGLIRTYLVLLRDLQYVTCKSKSWLLKEIEGYPGEPYLEIRCWHNGIPIVGTDSASVETPRQSDTLGQKEAQQYRSRSMVAQISLSYQYRYRINIVYHASWGCQNVVLVSISSMVARVLGSRNIVFLSISLSLVSYQYRHCINTVIISTSFIS